MKCLLSFVLFLLTSPVLLAQNIIPNLGHVFDDSQIPRVEVWIANDSLDALLAPGNEYSNYEYAVTFIFDNGTEKDTLNNVGFRLRGNTSRNSPKKSFKLSFNTYQAGRKYKGLEKMNLNGEHNDPSISRSKIGWDLLRQLEIPGSRSHHTQLYINGNYRGVYLNVEHIDEEFAQKRFGNQVGNLYKCLWPATLEYISGNANDYKFEVGNRRTYDLKTNTTADNYEDLAHFIDVLNNTPTNELECALEEVFNVNAYLKAAAFDVMTANWDGPIYNKNNFYLYHDPRSDLFEYIPYDLDNTLGIDWLSINWVNRNIYNWSKEGEPRPIYNRLMQVPVYRKRFTYFMEKIAKELIIPSTLFTNIESIKNSIAPLVDNDPFYPLSYGFTSDDFNNSFSQGLDFSHLPVGIIPFLSSRKSAALNQLENTNTSPVVLRLQHNFPNLEEAILIRAALEDDDPISAELFYTIDGNNWLSVPFLDDGQQNDEAANDGIYGAILPGLSAPAQLQYYLKVSDQNGQESNSPPCGSKTINIAPTTANLVINEFMASNNNTIADEHNEYDDWIEIYNADNQSISLNGKFLSDDRDNPSKWSFPNKTISPGQYMIFWADGDPFQGEFHTNFKLKSNGEHIGIYDSQENSFAIMDSLSYQEQIVDVSQGRLPNGSGPIQFLNEASPGANNEVPSSSESIKPIISHTIQPNPFSEFVLFQFQFVRPANACLQIYDLLGRKVLQRCSNGKVNSFEWQWDGSINQQKMPTGLYFIELWLEDQKVLQEPLVLSGE